MIMGEACHIFWTEWLEVKKSRKFSFGKEWQVSVLWVTNSKNLTFNYPNTNRKRKKDVMSFSLSYLPIGQDMTQGQFLSGV